MGVARTSNAVLVGQWNRLRVRRIDWNGHVTLNGGPEVHSKSKVRPAQVNHQLKLMETVVFM